MLKPEPYTLNSGEDAAVQAVVMIDINNPAALFKTQYPLPSTLNPGPSIQVRMQLCKSVEVIDIKKPAASF
jgi:hypothetical protein